MAIMTPVSLDKFIPCLSSDTKPTNPPVNLIYETDTGSWYIYNGSAWVAYYAPVAQDGWRLDSKTVTFAAGTTGAVAFHTIATPSDDIEIKNLAIKCTTDLTSGGAATISFGTANNVTGLIGSITATNFDAGEWFTFAATIGTEVNSMGAEIEKVLGVAFGYNILTATITGGVIEISFWWRPRVAGVTLTIA